MTNKNNLYFVLLCGGSGTRLWPMSRVDKPKQFHNLASDKSLLQETYDRIKGLVPDENIYVSLSEKAVSETQKQLPKILKKNYIVEPISKNTGPAVAYSAAKIFSRDPLATIAVLSSDHTVIKTNNYRKTFSDAFEFVSSSPEYLLTVGIKPDCPNTGYGYIKIDKKIPNKNIYKVDQFVEKPNLETAKKYIASNKYLWNAGYFVFSASEMIKMFSCFAPDIYRDIKKILPVIDSNQEEKIVKKAFENFPKVPIDTAIAEKVEKIVVIPADLGWSDVGSWSSLYNLLSSSNADTIVSRGHHIGVGDKNCLFFAEDKLLATVGLENIVIVDTPDATLVCNKDKSQEIKELIEKLKKEGKHKLL